MIVPNDRGWRSRRLRATTSRRGAMLVELALTLPVLLFVLVATADFARAFRDFVIVTDRARSAALSASLNVGTVDLPTSDKVWQAMMIASAQYDLGDLAMPMTPQVAPTTLSSTTESSSQDLMPRVAVSVSSPFQTLMNYPGIPNHFTMSRTVTMRLQPRKYRMR